MYNYWRLSLSDFWLSFLEPVGPTNTLNWSALWQVTVTLMLNLVAIKGL